MVSVSVRGAVLKNVLTIHFGRIEIDQVDLGLDEYGFIPLLSNEPTSTPIALQGAKLWKKIAVKDSGYAAAIAIFRGDD